MRWRSLMRLARYHLRGWQAWRVWGVLDVLCWRGGLGRLTVPSLATDPEVLRAILRQEMDTHPAMRPSKQSYCPPPGHPLDRSRLKMGLERRTGA